MRWIPAAITISIKASISSLYPLLKKKKPTYETKTRRNQEEKNTPLRRVLRLLGVIALVRHCESLSGFAVRGFVEGIGDDVWEKLVKSDAWCGVVRGQSGPATDNEQTHKFFRQSRSSFVTTQKYTEVYVSVKARIPLWRSGGCMRMGFRNRYVKRRG